MSKRVLIVSPHFPPVNAPDMQRVRVALPYFIEAGWQVTVLTVADPTPTAPVEPELLTTIQASVEVVRAFCFSRQWTRLLGFNNVVLRSLPFLFFTGCRCLIGRRYDVVYFSTTMFTVLPLGRLWKILYGVPYVVDLQDPWISDYYERPGAPPPPGGWKFRYVQGLGRTLEGWTMRGVAQLITVSAAYTDAVRQRYPELRKTPATELPFGSPDTDLAHLRATLKNRPALLPAGTGRLAFAGAIGPGQLAALDFFFCALADVRRKGIQLSAHFFGTSYSPDARPATLALAAQYGLQDCVYEQPGRLRYFDALQITLEADANLLFGSTDLAYTPSKILAVLAAGRPVLALAPTGSAMIPRLTRLAQPCVTFSPGRPDAPVVREIASRLEAIASGHAAVPLAQALVNYDARAVAQRQLEILNAASAT